MKKIFVLLAMLTVLTSSLFAQDSSAVVETVDEKTLKQKISWEGDENALEYKVEVVAKISETSTFYNTTETFVIFSLPPGEYKFKIITYDFFGREALQSEWQDFTISKAYQPVIEEVQQDVTTKKRGKIDIPVHLEDVPEDAQIVLINTETNKEVPATFTVEPDPDDPEKKVINKLTTKALPEGNWKISITNPGGKTSVSEEITFAKDKTKYNYKNINIQAGLGLDFFLNSGSDIDELYNDIFIRSVNFCFNWLPFTLNRNIFGFEFQTSYHTIQASNRYISISMPMHFYNLNLVYQLDLSDGKWLLEAKAGGGVARVKQEAYIQGGTFETRMLGYFNFDSGLFIMFRPFTHMNIEAGVEYTGVIAASDYLHCITPVVNIGLSF